MCTRDSRARFIAEDVLGVLWAVDPTCYFFAQLPASTVLEAIADTPRDSASVGAEARRRWPRGDGKRSGKRHRPPQRGCRARR